MGAKVGAGEATSLQGGRAKIALLAVAEGDTVGQGGQSGYSASNELKKQAQTGMPSEPVHITALPGLTACRIPVCRRRCRCADDGCATGYSGGRVGKEAGRRIGTAVDPDGKHRTCARAATRG